MKENQNPRVGKVGGQAVLEGIMMRGPKSYTTAVRKADGSIIRDSHPNEIKKKNYSFKVIPAFMLCECGEFLCQQRLKLSGSLCAVYLTLRRKELFVSAPGFRGNIAEYRDNCPSCRPDSG